MALQQCRASFDSQVTPNIHRKHLAAARQQDDLSPRENIKTSALGLLLGHHKDGRVGVGLWTEVREICPRVEITEELIHVCFTHKGVRRSSKNENKIFVQNID